MRYAAQQVELALDKSQNLFWRGEESNVPKAPQDADDASAQVTDEAGVWDEDRNEQVGYQGRGPGRDAVGTNCKVRVCAVGLDSFDGQEKKDPDAARGKGD